MWIATTPVKLPFASLQRAVLFNLASSIKTSHYPTRGNDDLRRVGDNQETLARDKKRIIPYVQPEEGLLLSRIALLCLVCVDCLYIPNR